MKTLLKLLAIGTVCYLGAWLFDDAGSFYCVMRASPGMDIGCYTGLETLLRLPSSTAWMRPAERGIGLLLLAGGFAYAVSLAFDRWRKMRSKAPAAPA